MTHSPIWRRFESGDGLFFKVLQICTLIGAVSLLGISGILELTWPQQTVLGLLTILVSVWLDRSSSSYLVTLTLMLVSVFSTFRYGFWRMATTIGFFLDAGSLSSFLDGFFIWLLVLAEAYTFLVLTLGYLQTLWPLHRTPVPLPDDVDDWPAVDLLITTLDEPLSVAKYTALAAINIDWPADKLNVYLLDDGRREDFRRFAQDAGIGYITRENNRHGKAGNINHALARLTAPYVAVFDCDHVPTRSFLQVTMGWFLRDRKLGLLQTPHHFYSPDPSERNLDQFRVTPNEGELFYGIVQDGNDFWNSTFFCGSCAVMRRSALDEIGGIAVETVTEDAHTSLRLQMKGWNTAYINIPQASGLATEQLRGHVRQRIRWARGMIQIMRSDNPLFAKGLNVAQRLCYFTAMTHFLYALPRLIFLAAPLIYLIFGHMNIPGFWAAILAYACPHLVLSNLTNSRVHGAHRYSFWNEIYETVLAPYIFLPTMLALIHPKLCAHDVTSKGEPTNGGFFDTRIAQPFLFMILMNIVGILCAIPRIYQFSGIGSNFAGNLLAGMYDGGHMGIVVMNLLWACFNTVILAVATSVAWETQQRRQTIRMIMTIPAKVQLANGAVLHGKTADMSVGGLMLRMERDFSVTIGESVRLVLPVLDGDAVLPATLVGVDGSKLRVRFDALTLQEEEALAMVLYSRADTWLGAGERRHLDDAHRSLGHLLQFAAQGFQQTVRALFHKGAVSREQRLASSITPLLVFTVLFATTGLLVAQPYAVATQGSEVAGRTDRTGSASQLSVVEMSPVHGAGGPSSTRISAHPEPTFPGSFESIFTPADIGALSPTMLRGADAHKTISISLPRTEIVSYARFSPEVMPSLSHPMGSLNGTVLASLPIDNPSPGRSVLGVRNGDATLGNDAFFEATLRVSAEKLVQKSITFKLVSHDASKSEYPAQSVPPSEVDTTSRVEIAGSLGPPRNDLNLLPLPFYDSAVDTEPIVPIVFLSPPSAKALRAAGIVASWFGVLADSRPVRFPVSVGTIPNGNAILISEDLSLLPASLQIPSSFGPNIAMRLNPVDPQSQLLILTGESADSLLAAAFAISLQHDLLHGDEVRIPSVKMPAAREPDDAPRWLSTDKLVRIGDIVQTERLQSGGSCPISVAMRLPPDLYYGTRQNLQFDLNYEYNSLPISNESALSVFVNNVYVSSKPLPQVDSTSAQFETVISVPISEMRPFSNAMLIRFKFFNAKNVRQDALENLRGRILKSSTLDIRGIPHWASLPNLELFANAGYPFTRRADLADTVVVMPEAASAEELEIFLTLMGHFGAQTGYPVLNVTVSNADGMTAKGDKDYLVLGTAEDQPALGRLSGLLPAIIDGSGLHIQDTQGFFAPLHHAWWKVRSSDRIQSGQLETVGGLPDALLEGIEWPRGSSRSVVVVTLRDRTVVSNFLSVFLRVSQTSDVAESVSVLRGGRFDSYRIGDDEYKVGSLSAWVKLQMLFSEYQWLMAISMMASCFFLAVILRTTLRRHARSRLQGNE